MMLEVKQAGFRYSTAQPWVFDQIHLEVDAGEILCILGPNGVGKTTLLKCIAGLLPLIRGNIVCNGDDLAGMNRLEVARQMAFVPQMHQPVFAYSVFETVLMGRTPHLGFFSFPKAGDEEKTREAITELGINHLSEKPYTQISGGERQLVLLARALAQEPRTIVLDEPTAHLDYGNQVKILSLVRRLSRQGSAVIMTSHNPDHAFMIADKVGIMFDRQIRGFGRPQTVVTEEALYRIYGIRVRLLQDPTFGRICVPALEKEAIDADPE